MPKYKVLDSVAHNICDSFTSSMNYASTDFVMGHLLAAARITGEHDFFIDFVADTASPIFEEPPLGHVVPFYGKMFWDNVEKQGSARSFVSTARLFVNFDITRSRPNAYNASVDESPFTCTLTLLDNRGIDHSHAAKGWWSPELQRPEGLLRRFIVRLRGWLGSKND